MPQPLWIIDSWWSGSQDPFLADSFGSFRASFARYPFPRSLGQFARSITLMPTEAVNDPRLGPRPDDAVICDRLELINRIADDPRIYGLAELSAWSCPRLEFRHRRWSISFKLVVGDAFGDRVAFWNSRSLLPRWLDKSFCSARVPTNQIQDHSFVAALDHLLEHRNRISEGSSSPSVTICSTSITREYLEQVRDKLREPDRLTSYSLEMLTSLEACAPNTDELSQPPVLAEWGLFQRSPTWEQVNFLGTSFQPSKVYPQHITDYQILPHEARDGSWALDLDIERASSHSPYTNVRQRWRLPRRLRMAGAFRRPYQSDQFAASWRVARATKEGFLSIYLSHEEAPPEILVPDDRAVFSYALHHGPDSWTLGLDQSQKAAMVPRCAFSWSQLSNVGRYLTGVLYIFGGLKNAADILLHRFWMQQFEHLGATHNSSSEQRISEVTRRLKRRLNAAPGQVKSSARDIKLNTFIDAARKLRPDIALLAVMEAHSAALEDKVQDLRTALQDSQCTCKLMTLKSHDFENDMFLRCLDE